MDSFYIVTNKDKDPEFQTTRFVKEYLEKREKNVPSGKIRRRVAAAISTPMLPLFRRMWTVCWCLVGTEPFCRPQGT